MIENQINNYVVILIYGALILLSILLIANPLRVNKKANFWFGVFLFLWSSYWLEEVFALTNIKLTSNLLIIIVRFIQTFTPILFYISIVYYTNPDFKLKKKDIKYLLVLIL